MGTFIGIDLGTTFSAIAKIDESGRSTIMHNSTDNTESNLMPSCVAFDEEYVMQVGNRYARRIANQGDANAVRHFKRHMGTTKRYKLGGETHTPTNLSALMLKEIIENSSEEIGEIDEVVVTVPANFGNDAREATIAAAKEAGLNLSHIINEPTAAALYYSSKEDLGLEGVYAVYDLGGGTFDISIIRIEGRDIEVLTSNGIAKLGGMDFDAALKDLVERKYKEITNENPEPGDYDHLDAEDDKKQLSAREKVTVKIARKSIAVTRKEFEEVISSKITQADILCESTIEDAGLKPSDIRGVLCAGGSTRIPMVQESIRKVFGQDPIFKANVDEVVALGAALYAAYKGDHSKLSDAQRASIESMGFTERTGKYYGTIALNSDGDGREENVILIEKNREIPCEVTQPFYTTHEGQTAVRCEVTESGHAETDPQFVVIREQGTLSLPPGRPAKQEIKVTFGYNENQTMSCSFEDVETGEKEDLKISMQGSSDPDSSDLTVE